MDKDRRYKVVISLTITDQTDGTEKPFFGSANTYEQLPMPAVLQIEQEMVAVLTNLVDYGKRIHLAQPS